MPLSCRRGPMHPEKPHRMRRVAPELPATGRMLQYGWDRQNRCCQREQHKAACVQAAGKPPCGQPTTGHALLTREQPAALLLIGVAALRRAHWPSWALVGVSHTALLNTPTNPYRQLELLLAKP